jgi:hypothetical protein
MRLFRSIALLFRRKGRARKSGYDQEVLYAGWVTLPPL